MHQESANNTGKGELGVTDLQSVLQERVHSLLPELDQAKESEAAIEDEIAEKRSELKEKRRTRREVEKFLRSIGALPKLPPGRPGRSGASRGAASAATIRAFLDALHKEFTPGEEFTRRQASETAGVALETAKQCLEAGRKMSPPQVRQTGKKVPKGSRGHQPAVHYALMPKE